MQQTVDRRNRRPFPPSGSWGTTTTMPPKILKKRPGLSKLWLSKRETLKTWLFNKKTMAAVLSFTGFFQLLGGRQNSWLIHHSSTRLLAKIGSIPGFKTAAFPTKGIFFLMSTTKDIMSIGTAAKNIIPQVLSRLGPEEDFIQLSLVSLLLQHFANKSQKMQKLIENPNITNRYHGNIPNWHIFLHIISCLHSEPFLENRANLHRPTWVKRSTRARTTKRIVLRSPPCFTSVA